VWTDQKHFGILKKRMAAQASSELVEEVRAGLFARMNARRLEMEQAIFARVCTISESAGIEDGEYASGLRRAVAAGVSHGLAGVQRGEEPSSRPIPPALLAQARQAARSGITPDVALRQYFAAYTLLGDFIIRAAEDEDSAQTPALGKVMHTQAALFERTVVATMGEYMRTRGRRRLPERRQIESVKKLLADERVDTDELAYEFSDWHIGAIARGDGAAPALRDLARAVDRRLLLVRVDAETAWAWFGGQRRIALADIARRVSAQGEDSVLMALGEPARGIEGWRLTHQQASAALRIVRPGAVGVVRYVDVGLLASISQDQVLASSLRQLYLAPLAEGRDGGAGLRETLRAYFTAGRNISSAASALGVSRQTVRSRLRAVEEKLGRTLESCAPEVEVALRLEGRGDLVDLSSSY
jgi:PucR C-terminal helix-turn-helix domain/GGDEF-like domain